MARKPKSVSKILEAAADLLEKKQWVRNSFAVDKNGCSIEMESRKAVGHCAAGAICRAMGVADYYSYTLSPVKDAMKRVIGERSIVNWNDSTCKSKRQAVATLRKAARLAAKEEARVKATH